MAIEVRQATDTVLNRGLVTCCREVAEPPTPIFHTIFCFTPPNGSSETPVVLSPPEPAFSFSPANPAPCVEGPVTGNVNSGCGLHLSCGLPFQANRIPQTGESVPACRGGVSASTQVQPVNINQSPEPPARQVVGQVILAQGQVPGSIHPVSSFPTTAVLVICLILAGLYFVTE